jgi:hypothetical protein
MVNGCGRKTNENSFDGLLTVDSALCEIGSMGCDVDLIPQSDERFARFVAKSKQQSAAKDRGRFKDSFSGEHQQNMRMLEAATLSWFATFESVAIGMVLISKRNEHSVFGMYDCLETDFVLGAQDSPELFGELKISISPEDALKAARKQLRKRIAIGSRRWPHIAGVAICFSLDWGTGKLWTGTVHQIHEIEGALNYRQSDNGLVCFVFGGSELMSLLVSKGFLDPTFPEQVLNSFRLMNNPTSCLPAEVADFSMSNAFGQIPE